MGSIQTLTKYIPSVATIELHDEMRTPFLRQLGWCPAVTDSSLVKADKVFVKYGYSPSCGTLDHLRQLNPDRDLVCGIQTDTCILAAGFVLFDAGLRPTLVTDLTIGSSLDKSGQLGVRLWKHHFRQTISSKELLMGLNPTPSDGVQEDVQR